MPSQNTIKNILAFASQLDGIDIQTLSEGLKIANIHDHVKAEADKSLAGWGLTPRQIEIMEFLFYRSCDFTAPAELSDEVGLDSSALAGILKSLEKLGLAIHIPHHSENRKKRFICLTPAGRKFMRECLPVRYKRLHDIISCLSKNERDVFLRLYGKIAASLQIKDHGLASEE